MGWAQIKNPKRITCKHCTMQAWKGAVWLFTKLGLFCSSDCYSDHGGDAWDN